MELRDYQKDIRNKAIDIIREFGIVYLAMEVRTGKTLTSLDICKYLLVDKVLFVTKKKAIASIQSDYEKMMYSYNLTVTNYDQLHNFKPIYDLVVFDEAHCLGAFAKATTRTKEAKKVAGKSPIIYLSGTPTPESYSQIFHQLWVSNYSPFKKYANFYKWSKDFVNVKQKNLGYGIVNDYSDAKIELIKPFLDKITINYTQQDAGFNSIIDENIIEVEMSETTYKLVKQLRKDLVIQGKTEVILADTAVKLQSKLHQLFSGTIKFESGKTQIIDTSKVETIFERFYGDKIVIFYKFIAELEAIKSIYKDSITTDLIDFNSTDKSIALQIVSGREGLNLSKAEFIVFYNIDFSATSYWQARDRMTTIDRKDNQIFWVFAKNGIEHAIYKAVMSKKNFTTSHFKKYLNE